MEKKLQPHCEFLKDFWTLHLLYLSTTQFYFLLFILGIGNILFY